MNKRLYLVNKAILYDKLSLQYSLSIFKTIFPDADIDRLMQKYRGGIKPKIGAVDFGKRV